MKKWLLTLFIIVISLTAFKAEAQTITQTYIDPCDQKVYVVVIPFGQNQTIAVIRGKSKIVTLADISSGAFQKWVDGVFSTPCSTQNDAIKAAQDAAAKAAADAAAKAAADAAAKAAADAAAKAAASAASNAAGNAASSAASGAASNAASSAASNAASSAASGAASNAASGAAGGAASSAAASAAAPPPPPPPTTSAPPPPPPASGGNTESSPPPTQSGGSSSSSSSQSGGSSSSSESKPAESKPAETKSDKPAEQKQEEKKTESKSEEKKEETKKEEKKEESKEEKKDEKKEDKKEEKKKEEKKKQEATNPTLLASDITVSEASVGKYLASISLGLSKSSLAGDESYSAGLVVNSNLSSIVTTAGYTKMGMTDDGQLDAIHSYGTAFAYLSGNYMNLLGYTYIKPTPTKGTYGYNVGAINLFLKNSNGGFDYNMATSAIVFWTKPYQYSKKLTISPQVFTMFSPIAWNSVTGVTTVNRHMGFLLGSSFDYKISKRFGFSFNYKISGNTKPGTNILQNFLIGSRMVL
jgi:hypothetical protein